jgi:hypothetical protein
MTTLLRLAVVAAVTVAVRLVAAWDQWQIRQEKQ